MLVTDDDDDDDGGAVRTYNGGTPYCRWMMEDLQWFDTSLWMNEMMRTYNGGMPHLLLGGGEGGSSPATSPSWAVVWDHFHFPLVAPAVLLR